MSPWQLALSPQPPVSLPALGLASEKLPAKPLNGVPSPPDKTIGAPADIGASATVAVPLV